MTHTEEKGLGYQSPGMILWEDFMLPAKLGVNALHAKSGLSKPLLSHILGGTRRITPRTAARLALAFETNPKFWIDLQLQHDVRESMSHWPASLAH